MFERESFATRHDVQAPVRIALGGEQSIPGAKKLLKYRNAKGLPQRLAIERGDAGTARVGEDDHSLFERPFLPRHAL